MKLFKILALVLLLFSCQDKLETEAPIEQCYLSQIYDPVLQEYSDIEEFMVSGNFVAGREYTVSISSCDNTVYYGGYIFFIN